MLPLVALEEYVMEQPQKLLDLIIIGWIGIKSGLEVIDVLENRFNLFRGPCCLDYVAIDVVAHCACHVHRLEQQPKPVKTSLASEIF